MVLASCFATSFSQKFVRRHLASSVIENENSSILLLFGKKCHMSSIVVDDAQRHNSHLTMFPSSSSSRSSARYTSTVL